MKEISQKTCIKYIESAFDWTNWSSDILYTINYIGHTIGEGAHHQCSPPMLPVGVWPPPRKFWKLSALGAILRVPEQIWGTSEIFSRVIFVRIIHLPLVPPPPLGTPPWSAPDQIWDCRMIHWVRSIIIYRSMFEYLQDSQQNTCFLTWYNMSTHTSTIW